MEITSIKIQTAAANGDFRAFAHITFDNCLRVIGLRLFHTQHGYELFMPSRKLSSGQRVILAEPKTDEMKNRIKAAVIAEYERVTGENKHTEPLRTAEKMRHELQQRMDALARQYLETPRRGDHQRNE